MESNKNFYNAKDVKELLSCGSIRTAQLRIQLMNKELQERGYWIERGKVPIKFFHEKYPFTEQYKRYS
ncbi:hypothetical protein [Psychrobacillus sp. FSL K6-1267]|uniref:hypothetical protein n=1 Tax=Psychrobacillus sp. FSL K6-1267 TaxID=2921543 RepID=UPI0030F9E6F4